MIPSDDPLGRIAAETSRMEPDAGGARWAPKANDLNKPRMDIEDQPVAIFIVGGNNGGNSFRCLSMDAL
jgi:hypothetical protein